MASKLRNSTVSTDGDLNDAFDFTTYLTSSDFAPYDGFFSETFDFSEKSYDLPKAETPASGLFLTGTERDDTLYGSELNDEIHGLGGDDWIDGGDGNDLLFGGSGDDAIYGGAGVDTVSYADHIAGIQVDLFANIVQSIYEGEETGEGHTHTIETDAVYSIEHIIGTNYDDFFAAGPYSGIFDGGAGNDYLISDGGTTVLLGGDGDDQIVCGGRAHAWMTGGSGADEFGFSFAASSTVTDFVSGIDKIESSTAVFEDLPLGYDGILASGTDVPTVSNGDRDGLFYDTDDYSLYALLYDPDGQATATLLATFSNGVQLQTSDFIF